MTENAKKAIVHFAKNYYPIKDLDFFVQEHSGEFYLTLVVDVAKMDINSPQYDEQYFNLLTNKGKKMGRFDAFLGYNFLKPICDKLKKFMNVNLKNAFEFKNYEHLDDIENKISSALKKSSKPDVKIEFTAEWDKPKIILKFLGLDEETYKSENFDKFLEELKDIMEFPDEVSFESYAIHRTTAKK